MEPMLQKAVVLAAKVQNVTASVLEAAVGRADVVKATLLALISGRPVFFLGTPGVNKTGTVEALAKRIDGAIFHEELMPTVVSVEQLIVESTSIEETPTEGGGRSIKTRDTLGRAAAAHLVFADEIWKAEPRVLQTLLDLSKGDGVRHEGAMVKTPLMAFLAASNELPEEGGNLVALWSRMTLRVQVLPLDRAGKIALVRARSKRDRSSTASASAASGEAGSGSAGLTLDEVRTLRAARKHVDVPDEIVETVLDIYQRLIDDKPGEFDWLWADDRRFGRVFDILQANALLDGRMTVTKADLVVLEWMLWDTPEQIGVVKAAFAPYCRTPLDDAQELVDSLLSPGGTVADVRGGNRSKGVQALTQAEEAGKELERLKGTADASMAVEIDTLLRQVAAVKQEIINVITGAATAQRR